MKQYALVKGSLVVFALTIAASPALAQSGTEQGPQPSKTSAVEATPFVSMGSRSNR
jgi:hypothetical protein